MNSSAAGPTIKPADLSEVEDALVRAAASQANGIVSRAAQLL